VLGDTPGSQALKPLTNHLRWCSPIHEVLTERPHPYAVLARRWLT